MLEFEDPGVEFGLLTLLEDPGAVALLGLTLLEVGILLELGMMLEFEGPGALLGLTSLEVGILLEFGLLTLLVDPGTPALVEVLGTVTGLILVGMLRRMSLDPLFTIIAGLFGPIN